MARTVAELPSGSRITDYISLGVVAKTFPLAAVESVLENTGKASMRHSGARCYLLCDCPGFVHAFVLQ